MMMRHARAVGRNVLSRHGTVAAYLALLLASSTAAYAAATIGSPQVINNSLQSIDLRDGLAVKGVDVVDESLTGADINESTLSSTLARGTGVRVLSNRLVVPNGTNDPGMTLLDLDGLGQLTAICTTGWKNTTVYWVPPSGYVEYWSDSDGGLVPGVKDGGPPVAVAVEGLGSAQMGSTLLIGRGGYGLEARTAAVTIGAFRSTWGAACSVQATATIWTKP